MSNIYILEWFEWCVFNHTVINQQVIRYFILLSTYICIRIYHWRFVFVKLDQIKNNSNRCQLANNSINIKSIFEKYILRITDFEWSYLHSIYSMHNSKNLTVILLYDFRLPSLLLLQRTIDRKKITDAKYQNYFKKILKLTQAYMM